MRAKRRYHTIDRGIRGWIVNTAKRNLWRVASTHELEDLIQEGYLWYAVCMNRYGHIQEAAHFMALFKTTFINEIHTLSTKATRRVDAPLASFDRSKFDDVDQALEALTPAQPEEQTLTVLIAGLPAEIKELIVMLLNDARDIPMLAKETESQYLWRLMQGNPNFEASAFFKDKNRTVRLEQAFREHFAPA